MLRFLSGVLLVGVMATSLVGCDTKELDDVRAKVTSLEQQVAKLDGEAKTRDETIAALQTKVSELGQALATEQENVKKLAQKHEPVKPVTAVKKPASKHK